MSTSNTTTTGRRRRANRLVALLLALSTIAAACGGSSGNDTIQLGQEPLSPGTESGEVDSAATGEAVDFTYETFDGGTAAFAELPDGPVVLNFFASWCPTCVAELPDFESVANDLDGQVTFLGLATSDRTEASTSLIEETGVTFTTGQDLDGQIFRQFEGIGMPTTVFLDADHNVIKVHSGVFNAETLTKTINSELLS